MTVCWRRTPGGVLLDIKVQPGASKDIVGGVSLGSKGEPRLTVRVTAPPEDGRANKAALAILAEALGLPKSALSLASGEKARQKTVAIDADAEAVGARIDALVDVKKVRRHEA